MVMYPRRIALRRVVLEGGPREREIYVEVGVGMAEGRGKRHG
jgi:hypothetical protein